MALLNNILRMKVNLIESIVRRHYLLHDTILGQLTEFKELGRSIREYVDLRNRGRF